MDDKVNTIEKENKVYAFPDMNKCMISGCLVHNPPLRKTKKGVPVTNFIIATTRARRRIGTGNLPNQHCRVGATGFTLSSLFGERRCDFDCRRTTVHAECKSC